MAGTSQLTRRSSCPGRGSVCARNAALFEPVGPGIQRSDEDGIPPSAHVRLSAWRQRLTAVSSNDSSYCRLSPASTALPVSRASCLMLSRCHQTTFHDASIQAKRSTMTEPNPFETLQQMAGGYCLPRCLHVAANLRVADALDDAPQTAAQLAAAVGANPDALGRVLRLRSAHGVFTNTGGRFAHSPASRLLRRDHPQSMRDPALFSTPRADGAAGISHARRAMGAIGRCHKGGLRSQRSLARGQTVLTSQRR
jgi:hypothetical protein